MIAAERRRPPFGPRLLPRVALAWLAIALLLLLTSLRAIAERRFPDPDDTLRLLQVRDLIAGQGWFDLHQHRIDALHGGVPMHWSRLVDIPLALAILLTAPLVGQPQAEMIALVAVPLLTLGCALLLAGRIAWRMFDAEIAGLACLAMALSVPVIAQLRPLRIDHHGWQVVLALVAANGLMARSPRRGGWIAGLAIATWLAISIEGLPLAAVIAAICALRWLRGAAERAWLVGLMQGLAGGSAALFLLTRGLGDIAPHCDAISPVHLAMFAWGALIVTLSQFIRPVAWSLGGFAVAAGGALAILAQVAPQCAGGAFVELDPVVRHYWYDGVAEGLPVWRQSLAEALQIVVPAIFAIIASAKLAAASRDWLRTWWTDYTLLLCGSLAVAVLIARAGAVTGALSAVPLGWQISRWLRSARTGHHAARKTLAFVGVAFALLPAMPLTLYGLFAPASAGAAPGGTIDRVSDCRLDRAAQTLATLPRGELLVPLDIGPAILLDTPHGVVATGHHRAGHAMREVIDAFTGTPDAAHRIVSRRTIAYVALCPDLNEPATYYRAAPDGFAAKLRDGHAPDWLTPVPMPAGVGFKVWRVNS